MKCQVCKTEQAVHMKYVCQPCDEAIDLYTDDMDTEIPFDAYVELHRQEPISA